MAKNSPTKKRPTKKPTNKRKATKARYAKAREDAQLMGIIETVPGGAVRPEAVPASVQGEQALPTLDMAAIKRGWATPDEVKPKVVARLLDIVFAEPETKIGADGNEYQVGPDKGLVKEAAKVLMMGDKMQYERDNPEAAGKARGSTKVDVNMGVVVADPFTMYQKAMAELDRDEIEEAIKAVGISNGNEIEEQVEVKVEEAVESNGKYDEANGKQ